MLLWRCLLAAFIIGHCAASQASELEQLLTRARTASSTDLSHIDGAVFMRGNQPVCAFGVVQLPDEKPQYTYFVLFKDLPDTKEEFKVTGPIRSKTNQFNYKLIVAVGAHEVVIAHEYKCDSDARKTIVDDLSIGDEKVKPGEPRFFVVDLAAKKPTVVAVKLPLPETVLDPRSDQHPLDTVRELSESLKMKKEIAELLR